MGVRSVFNFATMVSIHKPAAALGSPNQSARTKL